VLARPGSAHRWRRFGPPERNRHCCRLVCSIRHEEAVPLSPRTSGTALNVSLPSHIPGRILDIRLGRWGPKRHISRLAMTTTWPGFAGLDCARYSRTGRSRRSGNRMLTSESSDSRCRWSDRHHGQPHGGHDVVQRTRHTARTLRQCRAAPRARSPPVRTFCDLTKRSLHDAHTRPHGR
jgi:hypothetical protein